MATFPTTPGVLFLNWLIDTLINSVVAALDIFLINCVGQEGGAYLSQLGTKILSGEAFLFVWLS